MKNEIIIDGEHYRLKANKDNEGCGACALCKQCLDIAQFGNKGLCDLYDVEVINGTATQIFEKK